MRTVLSIALGGLLASAAFAQDKPSPSKNLPDVPMRLHVVVSRYQGEKKISSHPYAFPVSMQRAAQVRMGIEVPVAVTTFSADKGAPATSFQYKNVGINLECRVGERLDDGRFRVEINAESSSLFDDGPPVSPVQKPLDAPAFRTRNIKSQMILRDGETQQALSAVEPGTNDIVKMDVTLEVLK